MVYIYPMVDCSRFRSTCLNLLSASSSRDTNIDGEDHRPAGCERPSLACPPEVGPLLFPFFFGIGAIWLAIAAKSIGEDEKLAKKLGG